ncbi:MAG: FkbM family methyltransferase [Sphingomicrobium sp.]
MTEIDRAHHKRTLWAVVQALAKPGNYSGVIKTLRHCSRPVDFLKRYLRNAGNYPAQFSIRTPIGVVRPTAFVADDVLTINEIFFRGDYGDDRTARTIVDLGSNVGISTLYFLSRNNEAFVYCYEPLPQNIERLKQNLRGFEERYVLCEAAVAMQDGTVDFGWEPTGRYGGIGRQGGATMTVPAVDSNRVLAEIVQRHGIIDLLKIDIEQLEVELTERIPDAIVRRIRRIVIENAFPRNPFPTTHDMHFERPITTLLRRDDASSDGTVEDHIASAGR